MDQRTLLNAHIFHQSLPIKSVIILYNPNIANLLPVTCLLKDGSFLHLNKHHIILLFSWIVLKKNLSHNPSESDQISTAAY